MRPIPSTSPIRRGIELVSAAGGDLQEVALLVVQVHDARLDQVTHRVGDLDVLDHLGLGPGPVGLLRDELALAQAADDLEGEEGVAVRLRADAIGEVLRQPHRAERVHEQPRQVLGPEAARATAAIECSSRSSCATQSSGRPGRLVPTSMTGVARHRASASAANSARPASGAKCRSSISRTVGRSPRQGARGVDEHRLQRVLGERLVARGRRLTPQQRRERRDEARASR